MADFLENEFVDSSISKLYLKDDLADVKFVFNHNGSTVLVPAHKLILACGNPVFRAMFFGSLPEKGTVEIVDATAEEFKEFLQFFYLRKIKLTMDNMEGVTRLADKYDMLDCLNTCAGFLESKLTDNNMLWGYQLAVSLNNEKLKEFCEGKIALLSADIFKTESFLNCDRNVLKCILMMNELACDEIDIFEACVNWAKVACRKNRLNENDSKNLKDQLGDSIYLIQFSKMTNDQVGGILINKLHSDMFNRDELLEITSTSLVPNFLPKIFKKSTQTNSSFLNNKNPELVLDFESNPGYVGRYFKAVETTRFSSNISLLLGKIIFSDIIGARGYRSDLNFDVINCNSNKTLYNGKVNYLNREVNLVKGIPIKPQEMYMIRVNISQNLRSHSPVRVVWNNREEIKMNTDIIVTFHQNPEDEQIYPSSGIVSSISFKKL